MRANHYFYRSANIVTYYERFYPYIYQIDNDSIKYFTNLLTKKIPTKDEVEQWSQGTPSEQFMKSMQYVGDISACYETEKYIFITIQGMPPGYGIINKENNQTYYMPTHKYKNMPNGGAIATTGKEFISYMIPTEDNIQQILSSVTDTEKQLQIKSLDEESNPILVLFSYK
ncbi:MAG: 6-bladed beta-propeller [Bacteroides intestinalis]|uniref:6-bladed beta-propeller n=1 Tax=Bacteroides intestinalis TaxID=329854 RepID=UPI0025A47C80|nr:6-bladed beta-propeller [Bacteroides intestinalis]